MSFKFGAFSLKLKLYRTICLTKRVLITSDVKNIIHFLLEVISFLCFLKLLLFTLHLWQDHILYFTTNVKSKYYMHKATSYNSYWYIPLPALNYTNHFLQYNTVKAYSTLKNHSQNTSKRYRIAGIFQIIYHPQY